MKRNSIYHLISLACLLALVAMPLVAAAADTATVNSTTTPTCMTPGQKVNVTVNVTNTGGDTWYTSAPCPPGVTPTPMPGVAPDCRHAITYKLDGNTIEGDFTDLPSFVSPGNSSTISAKFCASNTTATHNCDAANPSLALGPHTVEWYVVHQYVGKVPTGKTANFEVKNSCTPGGGDSPLICPDGSTGIACICKRFPIICRPQYELPRIKKPWPPEWMRLREEILDIKTKYPNASPAEKLKMDKRTLELNEQMKSPAIQKFNQELELNKGVQPRQMDKNLNVK